MEIKSSNYLYLYEIPILTKGVHSVPPDSNTVRCTVYSTQVIPHYTCVTSYRVPDGQ
jgi:hypothetical protein